MREELILMRPLEWDLEFHPTHGSSIQIGRRATARGSYDIQTGECRGFLALKEQHIVLKKREVSID